MTTFLRTTRLKEIVASIVTICCFNPTLAPLSNVRVPEIVGERRERDVAESNTRC